MALTETQKRNAEILHSQGDTAEQIAQHLAVKVSELPASVKPKTTKGKATKPVETQPEETTEEEVTEATEAVEIPTQREAVE